MPYSRKRRYPYKSRYRRSGYRAKRYRGLIPTYRGFAGPQQLKAEWKYLDTAINQPINTTGAQKLLNALAPGSGASQRIGMKVSIRSSRVYWLVDCSVQVFPFFPGKGSGLKPSVTLSSSLLSRWIASPPFSANHQCVSKYKKFNLK